MINRDYYNTAWQVLEVRIDPDGDGVTYTPQPYKQFLWDLRYIDAPVLRWRDTDLDGDYDETLYYTNDANMNVTAVVNTAGDVVERYAYTPYGKRTVLNGDAGVLALPLSGAW